MGRVPSDVRAEAQIFKRAFRDCGNDRTRASLMLRLFLMTGGITQALRVPLVTGYRFDFATRVGVIDLVLAHDDDSISLVEAQPDARVSAIVERVDRLLLCVSAAAASCGVDPARVRCILCAAVSQPKAVTLKKTCDAAGVRFAMLPNLSKFLASVVALEG